MRHTTRGKRIQIAEPRRCAAFDSSRCPSSHGANRRSQYAIASSCDIASSPAARHVSSGVSTMNVDVSPSYWYACAWNQPCGVSTNANVNAGNSFFVPSQTKRQRRTSMSGANASAYFVRMRLLRPSDAMTTSAPNARAAATSSATSCSNTSSTPSASQRACRMLSSRLRPMPQNPWPPDVIVRPLKWTSMSSQWLNAPAISRGGLGIGRGEIAERLVGEHDAPAERVVRPVALDDPHDVPRVRLLEQQTRVQARGTAADAEHAHCVDVLGWTAGAAPAYGALWNA